MPDLTRICKRFQKGMATLEDVVRVYQVVLKVSKRFHWRFGVVHLVPQLPGIRETLDAVQSDNANYLGIVQAVFTKAISVLQPLLTVCKLIAFRRTVR